MKKLTFLLIIIFGLLSLNTLADNCLIQGYVFYANGTGVPNGTYVNITNINTSVTYNLTTDPDNFYLQMTTCTQSENHTYYVIAWDDDNSGTNTTIVNTGVTEINITMDQTFFHAPFDFNIRRKEENYSKANFANDRHITILNWSEVPAAEGYNLYYSSNLTGLMNLNVSNLAPDIGKWGNITILNYTDTNASQDQIRYYKISAFRGTDENITEKILGKQSFYFLGVGGTLNPFHRENWFGIALNNSYNPVLFMNEVGNTTQVQRMKYLGRDSSSEAEIFNTEYGISNPQFSSLIPGVGYRIETKANVNHTIVGEAITNIITWILKGQGGTLNPLHRENWISLPYINRTYLSGGLLEDIGSNAFRIKRLVKTTATNPEIKNYESIGGGINWTMVPWESYSLEMIGDETFSP